MARPTTSMPSSRVVQEGWLLKRSKTLHVWRRRWASLWEDETDGTDGRTARLLFSPEAKMYQETSEIFHLSQILSVCEAQLDSERSHCFVLQHQETSSSVRLVGLQAADAESLNQWLTALRRSRGEVSKTPTTKDLPTLLESSPISAAHVADVACHAAASSTEGATGSDKGPLGKGSKGCAKVGKGKGKTSKGPGIIPALPKGKGKGPPLPGTSGESSGKGKGKAQPKPLLFGKRLNLRDSGALPETARGEQPQENIFQGLLRERAGRTQEDIDTLHSYFQPKTSGRSEGRPTTPGSSGRGSMVGTPRAVFTDSVARNCAIVLRKLALKGMDLVKAVELLEPGPLDQDQLDRLAKVMPDQEKMAQLKLASSQKEQLRDVEQAMVPFAHLGRLQERLKALTLAANVQPNEQTFLTQLKTVSAACQEICDSHSLKNVLAIVLLMYNYVNFGQVERTDARAFDIANLLQLNDFRSDKGGPFPRFSALHYVALRLLKETPQSVRSLQEELGQVQEAAGICLSSVEVWIKELKSEIQELLEEQRANAQVYGGQEPTPTPAAPAPLAPASPAGRRGSMLSEVTEGTDDEHITPRTSRIELPQQTPRCGARMAVWLRTQLGTPKPLELGELARGMPQQCLDPDELHLSFEGRDPKKASVSISNLGLLYIRELEMENSVKAVPIIGSDVSLVSSPSFGEAIFEVAYSATPRLRRRLVLKANELTAACRWQRALKDAAAADGSGWLKVQNSFGFFRWTWATLLTVPLGRASEVSLGSFLLQPGSRWLVWFKTPEELLQGNVAGGVELAGNEVFSTDPRRFTFAVAHVRRERNTGREQMKQLVLRSGTDEDMKRWMTALRRPVQEPKPGPSPGRGASQRSIQSDATSGGGRQRIAVPRLNLGGSAETSTSARSKASSTSTEYTSPLKEKAKAKTKDTLWTEIHRDIITPRPSMTQNAPRIVDRCLEDDSSTESESESDSGSTSDSTTSTVSVGAAPAAPAPAAPVREPLSRRALTARAGNEEVTSFSRMSALAAEAEASATLLSRHLTDTLEDGKKLLIFLGQKPPTEPAELAVKVRSVFDTIAKFVGQFKCAAADVEKFQKKSKGGTTFNGENLGFYRRKKAEIPKAATSPSTAPVATPPTAQCKRLARDCVMHALFRVCQPEQAAPPRCWERRVVACRSPGRPPLLPSPGRAGPRPASARAGPTATAATAAATPVSLLEMLD